MPSTQFAHVDQSQFTKQDKAQPKTTPNIEDLAEQLDDAKVDHKKDPAMEDLSQALNKKWSPTTTDTKKGASKPQTDWEANSQR